MPFRLVTLGGADLRRPDGIALNAILSQPKRLALAVSLALARPTRFVRRDQLIALFWPDLDQEHARGALRQAVRAIRREMGEASLVNRGDEEIGFAEGAVACDAVELRETIRAGRPEAAVELYTGDLLPGFHVEGAAPEFDSWLDDERARLRAFAADAASGAADLRKAAGDTAGAARLARRACELAPYDEGRLRTLIHLLDALGDRAEAVRAYEDFTRRLARDLEVAPSTSSRRLVRDMRARSTPTNPSAGSTGASRSGRQTHAAVAVFENRTGDASLDGVGDEVANGLTRSLAAGGTKVVDVRARLGRASALAIQSAEGAVAVARLAEADLVIWGSYYHEAERLRVEAWITEAQSGTLLKALEPMTGTRESISTLAAALGEAVLASIRDQVSQ